MAELTSTYSGFLNRRNKEILELREKGKPLKHLAFKYDLSIRQISRIIEKTAVRG
jgi:Mor family transcriptional regulator